ncbi:MAG: hypothetical protein Kow00107_08740 [Planctomycetota bacterium]
MGKKLIPKVELDEARRIESESAPEKSEQGKGNSAADEDNSQEQYLIGRL